MDRIQIHTDELDKLLKNISNWPKQLQDEVDGEMENSAQKFERLAKNSLADQLGISAIKSIKRKVGVSTGLLMGATRYTRIGMMNYEVGSYKKYAAYNEWGTITKVSVPSDLTAYAFQFKGRGIRKTGGMTPKHYFFSQRALVVPELLKNVKNAINRTLK